MDALITRTVENLKKNGFSVAEVQTAAQACEYLLDVIPENAQVGVGGSVSVRETGVIEALAKKGCTIHAHWGVAPEDVPVITRRAREADVYLCSANAVTSSGKLAFIDGRGNRVGALCDGPCDVYFIISHSKIVDGGLEAAIARIKQVACPQNARRLGLSTPCALTGNCRVNECEKTSCCMTMVLDHAPHIRRMTVVLVEEKLGY